MRVHCEPFGVLNCDFVGQDTTEEIRKDLGQDSTG